MPLLGAFARYVGYVWRRASAGIIARIGGKWSNTPGRSRSADARATFWAELREGQREAEAQASRQHS